MTQTGAPKQQYTYFRQIPLTTGPFGAPDGDSLQDRRFALLTFNGALGGGRSDLYLTETYNAVSLPWDDPAASLVGPYGPIALGQYQDVSSGIMGKSIALSNRFIAQAPSVASLESHRYEILSYILEPRHRAMGRVGLTITKNNIDATSVLWRGYADDATDLNPDDNRNGIGINGSPDYSHHRWHSGEFNNTIMEESRFWNQVITSMQISDRNEALSITPLATSP
jgi:hypothetical protein